MDLKLEQEARIAALTARLDAERAAHEATLKELETVRQALVEAQLDALTKFRFRRYFFIEAIRRLSEMLENDAGMVDLLRHGRHEDGLVLPPRKIYKAGKKFWKPRLALNDVAFSVLYGDIGYLTKWNDDERYGGHATGNFVVTAAAKACRFALRESACDLLVVKPEEVGEFFRLGGDEIAALIYWPEFIAGRVGAAASVNFGQRKLPSHHQADLPFTLDVGTVSFGDLAEWFTLAYPVEARRKMSLGEIASELIKGIEKVGDRRMKMTKSLMRIMLFIEILRQEELFRALNGREDNEAAKARKILARPGTLKHNWDWVRKGGLRMVWDEGERRSFLAQLKADPETREDIHREELILIEKIKDRGIEEEEIELPEIRAEATKRVHERLERELVGITSLTELLRVYREYPIVAQQTAARFVWGKLGRTLQPGISEGERAVRIAADRLYG